MSQPESIRNSGQLFVAAALAFITILSGTDPIAIPGSLLSASLLAVAMSRLRAAYGETVGPVGTSFLLLGVLGPVLWGMVFGAMILIGVTETQIREGLWVVIFMAPAISLLGLTLFGLTALASKPMPRLNWLPLFAGIWYPATFTLFSMYDISHKGVFPDQYLPALVVTTVIQFLALCWFGSTLISDSRMKLPTTG